MPATVTACPAGTQPSGVFTVGGGDGGDAACARPSPRLFQSMVSACVPNKEGGFIAGGDGCCCCGGGGGGDESGNSTEGSWVRGFTMLCWLASVDDNWQAAAACKLDVSDTAVFLSKPGFKFSELPCIFLTCVSVFSIDGRVIFRKEICVFSSVLSTSFRSGNGFACITGAGVSACPAAVTGGTVGERAATTFCDRLGRRSAAQRTMPTINGNSSGHAATSRVIPGVAVICGLGGAGSAMGDGEIGSISAGGVASDGGGCTGVSTDGLGSDERVTGGGGGGGDSCGASNTGGGAGSAASPPIPKRRKVSASNVPVGAKP